MNTTGQGNSEGDGNSDFGAFVKRQQITSAEEDRFDWAKERDDWLSHLKELYDKTGSFLATYTKSGEIKISYRDVELNEENIGSYGAPQMILKIGRQEITMTPVGTMLVGAKGRVEIVGPAGRARFLLVNGETSGPLSKVPVSIGSSPEPPATTTAAKPIKWVWKIATSPPVVRYIELTQDSLFQALMEVANG